MVFFFIVHLHASINEIFRRRILLSYFTNIIYALYVSDIRIKIVWNSQKRRRDFPNGLSFKSPGSVTNQERCTDGASVVIDNGTADGEDMGCAPPHLPHRRQVELGDDIKIVSSRNGVSGQDRRPLCFDPINGVIVLFAHAGVEDNSRGGEGLYDLTPSILPDRGIERGSLDQVDGMRGHIDNSHNVPP